MDGLLDIESLMARFGATEQDRKDANKQAAFALGFGLLAGRKGDIPGSIGRAGLGAMQAKQQSLYDSQQMKQSALQNYMGMARLQQAQQAAQAQAAQAQAQQAYSGELAGAFSGGPQLGNMGPGGPTPQNAEAVAPPSMIEQYRKAAVIAARNGREKEAEIYNKIALSMEAEYSTTPQTMKDASGNLASVLIGKRGETKKLDYLPAEKLYFANTGGVAGVGLNPFTGKQESAGLPVTMDPAQKDASARGWAGLNQSERHFREGQAGGEIKETADGLVRIGKDNRVTPILANGAQLQPKPAASVQQQMASNAVTMAKIDRALDLVQKTPGAFGGQNVLGDPVMQRLNPSGVEARAMVADIAGQKIHDRSGAAVTVGEAERLKPYVPNVTDTPEVVGKKLKMFKKEYAAMQAELQGGKSISAAAGGNTGGATGGWSIKEVK